MNTCSLCLSRILPIIGMLFLVCLAIGYTPSANAAGGCGHGYHRGFFGGCSLNYPGPFARPAPMHPGCWRNVYGRLRCYR